MAPKNRLFLALFILLTSTIVRPAEADTLIKIATLAPEGSSWMRLFRVWQENIETRTAGRVKIKFYAGGVQGDERDVLRKIRLGQIAGAAITGIGLSAINPESRSLEIARTYEQLVGLRAALREDIEKKFEEKGFLLISWGDVGPVHLFAKKPIRTLADLRSLKLWLWSDDPISKLFFDELQARGVPMGVPDVLPGLTTGQIDSFFATPLSALALQWATHAKTVTSVVVSQAIGATILSKKVWDTISADDQKIVREESRTLEAKVLEGVKQDNAKALDALKQRGLEVVPTSPELEKEMYRAVEAVARKSSVQVSKEFFQKVEKIVNDYVAKHPQK